MDLFITLCNILPTKCCSSIETTNSVWAGLFPFYFLCTVILNDRSTSISSCQLELGQGVALPTNNRFLGAHSGHWCMWGGSGSGKGMQKCGLFVPRTCVIIRGEPDCHLQLIQVLKAKCRKRCIQGVDQAWNFEERGEKSASVVGALVCPVVSITLTSSAYQIQGHSSLLGPWLVPLWHK